MVDKIVQQILVQAVGADTTAEQLRKVGQATEYLEEKVGRSKKSLEQLEKQFSGIDASTRAAERSLKDIQAAFVNAGTDVDKTARIVAVYSNAVNKIGSEKVSSIIERDAAAFAVLTSKIGESAAAQQISQAQAAAADSSRAASIEALRNKYVPLAAAQQQYITDLKTIKSAGNDVFKTEDERTVAINRTKDAFASQVVKIQAATKASVDHTGAVKLQNYQLVNFGQQLQDIGVSLAGGQNPFMVMVQQVPQMYSAVGSLNGIKQAFVQLGASATSFAGSPAGLAVAAIAAIGTAAYVVISRTSELNKQLREIGTNAQLLGRYSGDAPTIQVATQQSIIGRTASSDDALNAQRIYQQNLQITTDMFGPAMRAASNFSQITGKTMVESATKFSDAISGGREGIEKLVSSYEGLLKPAQLRNIERILAEGDAEKAYNTFLLNVAQNTEKTAEGSMSGFTQRWERLKDLFSNTAKINIVDTDEIRKAVATVTSAEMALQLAAEAADSERMVTASKALAEANAALATARKAAAEAATAEAAAQRTAAKSSVDYRRADTSVVQGVINAARSVGMNDVPTAQRQVATLDFQIQDAKNEHGDMSPEVLALQTKRNDLMNQYNLSLNDNVKNVNLQADAQERLTFAIGGGILAQQNAEAENAKSAYMAQNGAKGLTEYMDAYRRMQDAQLAGLQDNVDDQLKNQAKAARDLTDAWAAGDIEKIKSAQIDARVIELKNQIGGTDEENRKRAEAELAIRTGPQAAGALQMLKEQVALQERLGQANFKGDILGGQAAQLKNDIRQYKMTIKTDDDNDPRVKQFSADKQRQYDEQNRDAARNLKLQMDPEATRDQALEQLKVYEASKEAQGDLINVEEDIARRRMEINLAYEQGEIDKLEATGTFTGGAEAAMRRYALDASDWAAQGASLMNKSLKSVEDGFAGFANGTKTAGDAMRDFANVVLMEIERMAAAALMAQTVSPLMNALFSGIGEFAKGILGGGGSSAPAAGSYGPGSFEYNPGAMPGGGGDASLNTFATGGLITGPGTGTSDSVPAWVSNGEFVMNAESTKKHIGLLTAMNDNKYASGGMVGSSSSSGASSLGPIINIIDQRTGMDGQAGEGVSARSGGQGPDGRQIIEVLVTDLVNKALASGKVDKGMSSSYGVQRKGIAR